MAQLSDLVTKLQFKAQILPNSLEAGKFTLDFLRGIVLSAITEHNPTLTLATMTQAEETPVLLLAQIELCYVRASGHGNDDPPKAPSNIPSVGATNSPFQNWMKLAAQLTARYTTVCSQLGISSGAQNVVVVSTAYKRSERFGPLFELVQMPGVPPALISLENGDSGAGSVNVLWTANQSDQFVRFYLFTSLNPNIYRATNPNGVMAVPNLSPSASLVHASYNPDESGIIVPGLTSGVLYYFMLVSQGRGRRYSYSNEASIVVP